MSLNFPTSPTAGQTFPSPPVSGMPVYTWDGEKWTTQGGAIGTGYAPIDSPLFVGDPRGPTPPAGDSDNSLATTAFVTTAIAAHDASPALTGNPTAPTQAHGDNDTSIATTAFVQAEIAAFFAASVIAVPVEYWTASGTVTIPPNATKCEVTLQGGGGGSVGGAAAGSGATLFKLLTALTPGNTLTLVVGSGGTNAGTNGGNTALTSGTQSIATLTAGGGIGAPSAGGYFGGNATGGDINIAGQAGEYQGTTFIVALGGDALFGHGGGEEHVAATGYGSGSAHSIVGGAGAPGLAIFRWYR